MTCISPFNSKEKIARGDEISETDAPRLNAAQTPDWASANTISRAATISIIFDLFFRKGNDKEQYPLGS